METPQVLLILNCKSHRIHRGLIIHGQKLVDERCNTDALIDTRSIECSMVDEKQQLDTLYELGYRFCRRCDTSGR